ncbi:MULTISPECIES: hypothetical protein [unclassified Calothrix]|nr:MULTISPECIES: hypothetical protein [unclassified Calothrix]MBD2207819.1 hypothetical protein [Calothrix sp. FACHB-168]
MMLASDLILEAILNRNVFFPNAQEFIDIFESRRVQGYISSIGFENVCCVVRASINNRRELADSEKNVSEFVISLIEKMGILICEVDSSAVQQSRLSNIVEPASAVEEACAMANNLDGIITLHPDKFLGSKLPVYSEQQFGLEVLLHQVEQKSDLENMLENWQSENYKNSINLRDWLDNIFNLGWLTLEDIFGTTVFGTLPNSA